MRNAQPGWYATRRLPQARTKEPHAHSQLITTEKVIRVRARRETINESTEYKYITTYGVTVFGRPNNNTTTRIEEKKLCGDVRV